MRFDGVKGNGFYEQQIKQTKGKSEEILHHGFQNKNSRSFRCHERAQDQKALRKGCRKKRNRQVTSFQMEQGLTKDSRTVSAQQHKEEQSRDRVNAEIVHFYAEKIQKMHFQNVNASWDAGRLFVLDHLNKTKQNLVKWKYRGRHIGMSRAGDWRRF